MPDSSKRLPVVKNHDVVGDVTFPCAWRPYANTYAHTDDGLSLAALVAGINIA
jgi:hypothetical protein